VGEIAKEISEHPPVIHWVPAGTPGYSREREIPLPVMRDIHKPYKGSEDGQPHTQDASAIAH